jgi:uncharacterized protein (UPF0548 family)
VRAEKRLGDPSIQRRLAALRERTWNYDPAEAGGEGWRRDSFSQALPRGSYEAAKKLMWGYEFADPSIVRAFYDPDEPLLGRTMLLEIRFRGLLRFYAGTRVALVNEDEERQEGGRRARMWGWAYRTLEGHLERGQMDYQVWKWLDTGRVEYRIHAVSEVADAGNPIVRLGFRLFGRREQVKFARKCGERMVSLTRAAVSGDADTGELEPVVDRGVAVSPTD